MTEAVTFDFTMQQGDTKRLHISVVDSLTGAPISLVGVKSLKWWVAKRVTSTVRLFEKDYGTDIGVDPSGITVTNAAGGLLTITINPADTAAMSGEYYHELEVVDSAGDIGTVLKGTMTVVRSLITNPVP